MDFFRRILKPVAPANVLAATDADTKAARIDIMARTIWGEARGESLAGKEAVANVILNRLKRAQQRGSFWWGNSIEEICKKPYQFSCWNANDPNFAKIQNVDDSDPQFAICQRIARRALNGVLSDNTFGADHYHSTAILPKWALEKIPVATIGHHVFYKLEK